MTINVQPLESFRVGRTQLPIPCCLCGNDNLFDASKCRVCHAPMSLGRCSTGDKKKLAPQLIMALGADGVGKTVYLGMLLDLLNRQQDRCELSSCDAESISIQQLTIAALSRNEFPETTSTTEEDWKWAHLRLTQRVRRSKLDVFLADVAGRSILSEIDNPGKHAMIGPMMAKATSVMLIVDAARIAENDKDEEYFARQQISHMTELREIEFEAAQHKKDKAKAKAKNKNKNKEPDPTEPSIPPVAVVLMKADQCEECWDDPQGFVRSNMPALWNALQDRLTQVSVFATSVVGAVAKRQTSGDRIVDMPLRVEPRGVIEPFRWLIGTSLKNPVTE